MVINSKNRYATAPKNADYTIDQAWDTYSDVEHDRWNRLCERQNKILPGRADEAFLKGLKALKITGDGIPDMEKLSDKLEGITGWRIVPVADLVPDDVFFDHLANKRFPAGAFIRPESEFDYIQEPDIFHDIYGHVPMLTDPVFSDFVQAYGQGGMRALELGQLHNLARLYWYTVEFGLVKRKDGLRIYGAGILSSPHESVFCLEDPSPHRVEFDLERLMCTDYIIDDFQKVYFTIDSYQQLLDQCYRDFGEIYKTVKAAPAIAPDELIDFDTVINKGTQTYFLNKLRNAS